MKKVWNSGKWMAILYLGLVILFAGCLGPPSEDNPVNGGGGDNGTAISSWRFNVDIDNAKVDISSSDGLGTIGNVGGHTVEVRNNANCSWAANVLTCNVAIINKDPDETMWNVKSLEKMSTNGTANLGNTDFVWDCSACSGYPTAYISTFGTGGCCTLQTTAKNTDEPIGQSGYCVTESGNFKTAIPYNVQGCETYTRNSQQTPYQFIHPRCGKVVIPMLFKNVPTGTYHFWMDLSATWLKEIPRSGAVINDPRWSGTIDGYAANGPLDYRTLWIQVLDLAEQSPVAPGYRTWRLGSSKRSNVMTDPVLAKGRYFSVEVSYEFPDRMENNMDIAEPAPTGSYEYYDNFSFAIVYDNTVIRRVVTAAKTTPGGSSIFGATATSSLDHCVKYTAPSGNKNHCGATAAAKIFARSYKPAGTSSTNVTQTDYVGTSQILAAFETFGDIGYSKYYWVTNTLNGAGTDYTANVAVTTTHPINLGHKGLVHIDEATGGLVHQGADPEPDYIVGLVYFWVLANATSGAGSFIALSQTSYSATTMKLTNGTTTPASDDYAYCYNASTKAYSYGLCPGNPMPVYMAVSSGTEKSNPNLPGGYGIIWDSGASNGQGGYQVRNAHICVQ